MIPTTTTTTTNNPDISINIHAPTTSPTTSSTHEHKTNNPPTTPTKPTTSPPNPPTPTTPIIPTSFFDTPGHAFASGFLLASAVSIMLWVVGFMFKVWVKWMGRAMLGLM